MTSLRWLDFFHFKKHDFSKGQKKKAYFTMVIVGSVCGEAVIIYVNVPFGAPEKSVAERVLPREGLRDSVSL